MVSFDDLVRKHGRVKLYDDVCVEHIGFYAVESCACMGFIVYRDVKMIGAGSTVLEAMRSAGEGLRLEQPADAWINLYRRAVDVANDLTNYVEDRPKLLGAERKLDAIENEARALIAANKENNND